MKTWRERIAEARERGEFLREDQKAWIQIETCPAGEALACYGLPYIAQLYTLGDEMNNCMYGHNFDPDKAEDILERIYDRALELKRQP